MSAPPPFRLGTRSIALSSLVWGTKRNNQETVGKFVLVARNEKADGLSVFRLVRKNEKTGGRFVLSFCAQKRKNGSATLFSVFPLRGAERALEIRKHGPTIGNFVLSTVGKTNGRKVHRPNWTLESLRFFRNRAVVNWLNYLLVYVCLLV